MKMRFWKLKQTLGYQLNKRRKREIMMRSRKHKYRRRKGYTKKPISTEERMAFIREDSRKMERQAMKRQAAKENNEGIRVVSSRRIEADDPSFADQNIGVPIPLAEGGVSTDEEILNIDPYHIVSEREDRYGRTLYTKTCDSCLKLFEDTTRVNFMCDACIHTYVDGILVKNYELIKEMDIEMKLQAKKIPRTPREATKLRTTR